MPVITRFCGILVLGWAVLHRDELMDNWQLAGEGKLLNSINPIM